MKASSAVVAKFERGEYPPLPHLNFKLTRHFQSRESAEKDFRQRSAYNVHETKFDDR